jgi:hypothetical protein
LNGWAAPFRGGTIPRRLTLNQGEWLTGREVQFFHGHLEDGDPPVAGACEPPTQWLMMMPGSDMSPQPEQAGRPIKNA